MCILDDVQAMSRIFTTTFLKSLLSPSLTYLTIHSKAQTVENWRIKHQDLCTLKEYSVLGRYCSLAMAKCLKQNNISYNALKVAFEEHYDNHEAFNTHLHGLGITRKTWQEWVWKHFRHIPT